MLLECAEASALPAGAALAVDREAFARLVTRTNRKPPKHRNHPRRNEGNSAIHPPSSPADRSPRTAFHKSIAKLSGEEHLFFFDAIAPIVHADSINMDIAFRASRYGKGEQDEGDYINCPFTKDEYYAFVDALQSAERIELRSFEEAIREWREGGAIL